MHVLNQMSVCELTVEDAKFRKDDKSGEKHGDPEY